jgi:hypothetical protein
MWAERKRQQDRWSASGGRTRKPGERKHQIVRPGVPATPPGGTDYCFGYLPRPFILSSERMLICSMVSPLAWISFNAAIMASVSSGASKAGFEVVGDEDALFTLLVLSERTLIGDILIGILEYGMHICKGNFRYIASIMADNSDFK